MKLIKKLWRRLFPVRVQFVPQYRNPDTQINQSIVDFLPELVKSHQNCPEMFAMFYIELTALESDYHKIPKDLSKPEMFKYAVDRYAVGEQIKLIKKFIKLPATAAAMLDAKKNHTEAIKVKQYDNWGDN